MYCLFLLGGEYGIPRKRFILHYCDASILEHLSSHSRRIYNEYPANSVKKYALFNNTALYRGKEFFEWCSGLTAGTRYVYYCQIRRKLDELEIRENDSITLQDRDFLRRQFYDPGHHQTGWMKSCMFLLGRPFKSNSRNIWFKGI